LESPRLPLFLPLATARLGQFWKVRVGKFWRAPKTDFLEERDGRVSRLYTFIDQKLLGPDGRDQRRGA
jgi:hypothetical protein